MSFACPCCGYGSFSDAPGTYEICEICFWEDDHIQLAFPDSPIGANGCSLIEAQRNFVKFGASEERVLRWVRSPAESDVRDPAWRPLDVGRDRYLKWESSADSEFWQTVKERQPCLYYWRPDEYFLVGR